MSRDVAVIECEVRARAGTGGARAVRREGWVPGTLYGGDLGPVNVKLRYNAILKSYMSNRLIGTLSKIKVGNDEQFVIGREIQVDPVKDLPQHVDFMRVDENTRVDVEVSVQFANEEECPGLKKGGVLNVVRHTVTLSCPATAIPEYIEADLIDADLGASLPISMFNLPKGVTPTITDRDFTVATIATPSAVRSESEDEAEEGEEASVEVEAINQKGEDEA